MPPSSIFFLVATLSTFVNISSPCCITYVNYVVLECGNICFLYLVCMCIHLVHQWFDHVCTVRTDMIYAMFVYTRSCTKAKCWRLAEVLASGVPNCGIQGQHSVTEAKLGMLICLYILHMFRCTYWIFWIQDALRQLHLFFMKRLSSLGGAKCIWTIGRHYFGTSSCVLCREVYYTVSLFGRFH